MKNELLLVEKAVEIFSACTQIDEMNDQIVDVFFSTESDNELLVKLQDELCEKRTQLQGLEKEYEQLKAQYKYAG